VILRTAVPQISSDMWHSVIQMHFMIFTARCYAVVVRPSVHPSVCLSQDSTVPKRLNAGSRK